MMADLPQRKLAAIMFTQKEARFQAFLTEQRQQWNEFNTPHPTPL